jgi:hypothetical protein
MNLRHLHNADLIYHERRYIVTKGILPIKIQEPIFS